MSHKKKNKKNFNCGFCSFCEKVIEIILIKFLHPYCRNFRKKHKSFFRVFYRKIFVKNCNFSFWKNISVKKFLIECEKLFYFFLFKSYFTFLHFCTILLLKYIYLFFYKIYFRLICEKIFICNFSKNYIIRKMLLFWKNFKNGFFSRFSRR